MENWEFYLQTVVLGFSVVIVTLFVLYLLLLLMGRYFAPAAETPAKELTVEKVPKEDMPEVIRRDMPEEKPAGVIGPVTGEIPAGVVAAISAALYLSAPPAGYRYVIKSVQPLASSSPTPGKWAMAGRKEMLNMQQYMDQTRRKKRGQKVF